MKKLIFALLAIAIVAAPVFAGEKKDKGDAPEARKAAKSAEATKAEKAAEKQSGDKPAEKDEVLYRVGDRKITNAEVDEIIAPHAMQLPPQKIEEAKQQVAQGLIVQELFVNYFDKNKIKVSDKEIKTKKDELIKMAAPQAAQMEMKPEQLLEMKGMTDERIGLMMRMEKAAEKATSDKQVKAYMKSHPEYFKDTPITASHILLTVEPTATTKDLKAAKTKLTKVKKLIADGKISFEDAAKKYSGCPSKEKGGDLGEFTFQKMVTPFSEVAFTTEKGEVSDVFRTQYGYHILKVTEKGEPKDKQVDNAEEIAKRALETKMVTEVYEQAINGCPVVEVD
ncbi:MAG: peptidylprolyl isomerase [Phycisphaerae bacterium]